MMGKSMPRSKALQIKLRNREWKFLYSNAIPKELNGDCTAPDIKNRTIRIRPCLDPYDELETIIHECLHACYWDLSEEVVEESASGIAELLIRLGYHRERP